MRPLCVLVVLAFATAAAADDDDETPEAASDEATDEPPNETDEPPSEAGAGRATATSLHAHPGAPFVAVGGGRGVLYVVDGAGDVRASTDGGRTFTLRHSAAARAPVHSLFAADDAPEQGDADQGGTDPGDPFPLLGNYGYIGDGTYLDFDPNDTFQLQGSAGDLFAFPYGTTGEEYLEFAPDSPAFWDPPWLYGMPRPDRWSLDATLSSKMLGPSRARAPSLDSAASDGPRALAVDVDDPRTVFLAGPAGLERSDDGGATWSDIDDDNLSCCAAVAAAGGGRAVALGDHGLLLVDNGGAWPGAPIDGARFVAARGETVVVGAADRVFVSHDGGASFDGAVAVTGAHAAGFEADPTRVFVATASGLLHSVDGGATFSPTGGDAVADTDLSTVVVDSDPRHVLVTSGAQVLESTDGGASFQPVVSVDGDVLGVVPSADAHGVVHVLTATSAARVTAAAPSAVDRAALDALKKVHGRSPPAAEVLKSALARLAPRADEGGKPGWVPRVDVVGGSIFTDNVAVLDAVFLDRTVAGDAGFVRQTAEQATQNDTKAAFKRHLPETNPYVAVFLSWDLPSLFAPAAPPTDTRDARARAQEVEHDVIDALRARGRLLEELALRAPEDDDVLLQRALDLQEVDAHLTALSGLHFPALGGDIARVLKKLPADEPVDAVVAAAQDHLGVGAGRVGALARGAWWRPALPTVLVGGSWFSSSLVETDFLDEIGLQAPWITKSAVGHLGEARARLTWDLPHTLRSRDALDVAHLAGIQRDIAVDATTTYFDRRRAQAKRMNDEGKSTARDDTLVVDELTSILAGMTGRRSPQ